jgi:hypothetical protein
MVQRIKGTFMLGRFYTDRLMAPARFEVCFNFLKEPQWTKKNRNLYPFDGPTEVRLPDGFAK